MGTLEHPLPMARIKVKQTRQGRQTERQKDGQTDRETDATHAQSTTKNESERCSAALLLCSAATSTHARRTHPLRSETRSNTHPLWQPPTRPSTRTSNHHKSEIHNEIYAIVPEKRQLNRLPRWRCNKIKKRVTSRQQQQQQQ